VTTDPVAGHRPGGLFRSAATVGGMTMISRLLGFVRDLLIAATLGTGPVADAFVVAFRFPNLFRRLFAEGAFNAAFVPLFAKRLEGDGMASARRFAEEAMAVLTAAVVFLADRRRDRHAGADLCHRARLRRHARQADLTAKLTASPSPICPSCPWWRSTAACSTASAGSPPPPPRRSCSTWC
jgi:hypothetical protein